MGQEELLHIIVDKDVDHCPYGDEILDVLVLEGHCGILVSKGNGSPKQSELIAELAAQETLYPWELRQEDMKLLEKKETSIGKLTLKYQLPEGTVSTLLHPRYIELIEKAKNSEL
ncbi:MAG: hypothetical protein H0U98_12640 [Alphaproteobacteria bacterium]|nr:hypothetical protein [Alphaproteobacteria bacterium]